MSQDYTAFPLTLYCLSGFAAVFMLAADELVFGVVDV